MPPSPVLRRSPGRDLREDNYKRGCSPEGGFLLREKDVDLVLFNEMETKESNNFLLHSADDFDDSLSKKLNSLSSFKLGVSVSVRGESSDLLNAEEEKTDYDWLLTPPDTPLFRSLDDESSPVNLVQRGRTQSPPISISRSSRTEKSYRSSRSSASPQRLTRSPQSGNSTLQSRGRPSSARHSSPSPILRSSTPSLRSSSPIKPSTPSQRSSTPTSQKINIGSSGIVSSSGRGTSPVNTSRGSSVSPKFSAWQSTIPGFPTDAPPNLRTSLADRPASYVRGTSPASRNGRKSPKLGRQSVSPTATRSANSSYSFDRDRFSSQSKGSVASSGDDDVDSLHSTTMSISERSVAKKVGAFPNSNIAISKKASRTIPSSSAPKRSFDSALRQMERKSPQMFRPLLSSVPSTTFYVGNANSSFRPMISRNSSVTTSSNASSEHGASVALDTEGSDHDKDDTTTERDMIPYNDAQEDEVFIFDKVDELDEDVKNEINDQKPNIVQHDIDRDTTREVESEERTISDTATTPSTTVPESFYGEVDYSEVDCHSTPTCSKCGKNLGVIELMDKQNDMCPVCCEKGISINVDNPSNTANHSQMTFTEEKGYDESGPKIGILEWTEVEPVHLKMNIEPRDSCVEDGDHEGLRVDEGEKNVLEHQVVTYPTVNSSQSDNGTADENFKNSHLKVKLDASEAAGISLLLTRSNSSKWPVIQRRPFTATNIPCNDPSYARDSQNSMRNSIGHSSASTSSSVDWSSSKHSVVCMQRQSSSRKYERENSGHDSSIEALRRWSSFSGPSNYVNQDLVHAKSSQENFDGSVENEEHCITSNSSELDYRDSAFIKAAVLEENALDHTQSSKLLDDSSSEILGPATSIQLEEIAIPALPINEDCVSSENSKDLPNNAKSISDVELSAMMEEDAAKNSAVCGTEVSGSYDHVFSVVESTDLENDDASTHDSQSNSEEFQNLKSTVDEHEPSVSSIDSIPKTSLSAQGYGVLEESNITVENQYMRRSLTMEEATETILFCSSIIHDLAYEAARIAIEKEINEVPLEGSVPTITIPYKSSSDRKDQRGRTTVRKWTPKSDKTRQRQVETEEVNNINNNNSPLSIKTETDIKTNESLTRDSGLPRKVDGSRPLKLESKCNCTVM